MHGRMSDFSKKVASKEYPNATNPIGLLKLLECTMKKDSSLLTSEYFDVT